MNPQAESRNVPEGYEDIARKLQGFVDVSARAEIEKARLVAAGNVGGPFGVWGGDGRMAHETNPIDDLHYFSALTRLYRRIIKKRPELGNHAVSDLAGSELMKRTNGYLRESGHDGLTEQEVRNLLTGPYEPQGLSIHLSKTGGMYDSIGRTLGERHRETVASLRRGINRSRQSFQRGEEAFSADAFIEHVERIHGTSGRALEHALKKGGVTYLFDKTKTADLLAHRLKPKRIRRA